MPCLGVLATNPTPAKLRAERNRHGYMRVTIGNARVPVFTMSELIVLAACRGGYRPVGQPDKVIRL